MGQIITELLKDVQIPKFFKAKQVFPRKHIEPGGIPAHINSQLSQTRFLSKLKPGMRIAITAGSRGIANVSIITKAIVEFVCAQGASPFIVPAMGSHGGATAEGQSEILREYGITEAAMGCPIISSMEVVKIGETPEGEDVFIDKNAEDADGIIVSCRVKPHTGFRGPYESGIMKMMSIGLGKQAGAEKCHDNGFKHMSKYVSMFGKVILENAPVLFAVACIENAYDETFMIEAVNADEIEAREPELLKIAFDNMPKIIVSECDVLIVDQIGKNFSGDGMDPNITGTFWSPYASGGLKSQRVVVLDIHNDSHGNFSGLGMADTSTKRAFAKIDMESTYANAITCKVLDDSKIPCILPNDKEAIQMSIKTCTEADLSNMRVVRISNSLHVERILLSEAYWETVKATPNIEAESTLFPLEFDEQGNLL